MPAAEAGQLVLVAHERHVEVADLLLDHAPFLHPAQPFQDQAVHRERQRCLARRWRQLPQGPEGEAPAAPAQAFEDQGRGLPGHGLAQARGREQATAAQVGPQQFPGAIGLALFERRGQGFLREVAATHEEAAEEEFLGHAVRAREFHAALPEVDVHLRPSLREIDRAGVAAILQQQKHVGDRNDSQVAGQGGRGVRSRLGRAFVLGLTGHERGQVDAVVRLGLGHGRRGLPS